MQFVEKGLANYSRKISCASEQQENKAHDDLDKPVLIRFLSSIKFGTSLTDQTFTQRKGKAVPSPLKENNNNEKSTSERERKRERLYAGRLPLLAGGKVWKKWEIFSGRQLDKRGRRPQRSKVQLRNARKWLRT
jgi:hypothetical protein